MARVRNYMGRNFKKKRQKEKLSQELRSSLMSKIPSKETKLEQDFIVLFRNIYSGAFETNVKTIKGTPDLVFQDKKLCVFLDSDFWHGWQFSRWKHLMKNDFWVSKIENNRNRDKKITRVLRKSGWEVIRIWEHEIKTNPDEAISKVVSSLTS